MRKLACANWLLVEENGSSQRRAEVYKRKVAERGPRRRGRMDYRKEMHKAERGGSEDIIRRKCDRG